jgi:hypothetical protein
MYRKDLISREIEKLAKLIAKLIGLKNNAEHAEADAVYNNALVEEFGTNHGDLLAQDNDAFTNWLNKRNFSAEHLDALAKLMYYKASPFNDEAETESLLQKALIVFDKAEKQYHIQSFENLGMITRIRQHLNHA